MITVKLYPLASLSIALLAIATLTGCSYFPETRQRDRMHNPFPQLKKVAILPFFNQSDDPTVDTELVTRKYYAALQSVLGFEVMPVGVTRRQWLQYVIANGEPRSGKDFQQLAKQLGVEALVVGSVTDFDPYYPPRMAMTVNWFAANEGFHPIPAGYGLPWGTEQEKEIPRRITREAEFELARSQLATQTPITQATAMPANQSPPSFVSPVSAQTEPQPPELVPLPGQSLTDAAMMNGVVIDSGPEDGQPFYGELLPLAEMELPLPPAWPDPTDFIPDPPLPVAPIAIANHRPVLTHTRLYQGDDPYFTNRLADHVETGDDARPGGWQGYLKRSEDFIHFCCQLHITEMLESRGGRDESDLILKWPLSRY
jgi:hypothetical protein